MVVSCQEVWLEISNYLEDEVDPGRRAAMEEHFSGCERCRSVLEGTRNVVELYGDERMLEVPLGFSHRLQRRLQENMPDRSRRSFLGWMVAAAAAVVLAGGFELVRYAGSSPHGTDDQRSQQAQPGVGVPPDMMVVVAKDGKTFHVASCELIRGKPDLRTIAARDAIQEGYTPCPRCMKKYLPS